jgi:hypothetical protein
MRNQKIATVHHLQWDHKFVPWRIKVDERRGLVFATTEEREEGEDQGEYGYCVREIRSEGRSVALG